MGPAFEVVRRSVVTTVGFMVGVLTELVWIFIGNTLGGGLRPSVDEGPEHQEEPNRGEPGQHEASP